MGVTINKQPMQPKPLGGLIAFYWYQIFALDSAVVEVQEMFISHGGHLTNAMYHLGETHQINAPRWNKEKGSWLTDSQS